MWYVVGEGWLRSKSSNLWNYGPEYASPVATQSPPPPKNPPSLLDGKAISSPEEAPRRSPSLPSIPCCHAHVNVSEPEALVLYPYGLERLILAPAYIGCLSTPFLYDSVSRQLISARLVVGEGACVVERSFILVSPNVPGRSLWGNRQNPTRSPVRSDPDLDTKQSKRGKLKNNKKARWQFLEGEFSHGY
ncbi:hypothetical protein An07g10300 [Aspergillus niger]|uniref:Uncharacterized protein n=2 Tax=Aspergillus niger TaxID=5061 RepID=A2QPQ9_ASPNC|nr:hypothetical protein An07g10300 [Aspergillus niger]CAK45159.1 hypothetical protein An07g10300 [Aspergillus niger]